MTGDAGSQPEAVAPAPGKASSVDQFMRDYERAMDELRAQLAVKNLLKAREDPKKES